MLHLLKKASRNNSNNSNNNAKGEVSGEEVVEIDEARSVIQNGRKELFRFDVFLKQSKVVRK